MRDNQEYRARANLEWDLRLIRTFLITFSIRMGTSSSSSSSVPKSCG